jgi:hypothetical protein
MKTVIIEEFYKKEEGVVFRYWRYAGEKEWVKEQTTYREKPYVIWRGSPRIWKTKNDRNTQRTKK